MEGKPPLKDQGIGNQHSPPSTPFLVAQQSHPTPQSHAQKFSQNKINASSRIYMPYQMQMSNRHNRMPSNASSSIAHNQPGKVGEKSGRGSSNEAHHDMNRYQTPIQRGVTNTSTALGNFKKNVPQTSELLFQGQPPLNQSHTGIPNNQFNSGADQNA